MIIPQRTPPFPDLFSEFQTKTSNCQLVNIPLCMYNRFLLFLVAIQYGSSQVYWPCINQQIEKGETSVMV